MNRGKIGDNAVLVPVVEIVLTSGIVEQREILALDEDGQAGADINHMDLVMRADEGFAAPSDDESPGLANIAPRAVGQFRSEEHTSELQSLMRISYAVFCLKKKK